MTYTPERLFSLTRFNIFPQEIARYFFENHRNVLEIKMKNNSDIVHVRYATKLPWANQMKQQSVRARTKRAIHVKRARVRTLNAGFVLAKVL